MGQSTRYTRNRRSEDRSNLILRRILEGKPYREIAKEVGCPLPTIFKRFRGVRKRLVVGARPESRLSLEEREEISRGLWEGLSYRAIARGVRRSPSTISREVAANGGRKAYRAWRAEERALRMTKRPRASKLARSLGLRIEVERLLTRFWSPEQISQHLKRAYPDDKLMQLSHETIYRTLYVQTRGALLAELSAYLRTGRTRRQPQGRKAQSEFVGMVMIRDRPPEIEDRAVPGHWEGDLLCGSQSKSQVGTLVERKTRYVMLVHLPNGRTAWHVRQALTKRIQELPKSLKRSLTWDRGREMSEHQAFTVDTGVNVYFCDPHSPWQRGSNENTNGLLRQYLPSSEDLSRYNEGDLKWIEAELNQRPRKTLGWKTPAQAYAETVAMTE